MKNILPPNLRIPPPKNQNILMQIAASSRVAENRGTKTAIPHNLHLHLATHRLGDSKCAPQHLHLHRILCLAPVQKTRLEWMSRDGRWGD